MVLVTVIPILSQYQVWLERTFNLFKRVLDFGPFVGKITLPIGHRANASRTNTVQKLTGTCLRFTRTCSSRAKDQPINFQVRLFLDQAQDGRAATDFYIVAVRPQTKHLFDSLQPQACHWRSFQFLALQTVHGALPRVNRSSSSCLSLKVSMHAQKPSW